VWYDEADSPPQGEPIGARVTVGRFRAHLVVISLSHPSAISRVDGVLIDEMSFRDRHYLSYGLQGVWVESPRQRNVFRDSSTASIAAEPDIHAGDAFRVVQATAWMVN
jgi:hypothetical protein